MANNYQVVIQMMVDPSKMASGSTAVKKQLEEISKAAQRAGQDAMKAMQSASQDVSAATKKNTAALNSQSAAVKGNNSAWRDKMLTNKQLAHTEALLHNAWNKNTNLIDNRYLKSIDGLKRAMRLFNSEASKTMVMHKGVGKTLDDVDLKYTRFIMKGNLVVRTLSNMATNLQNVGKNAQWTGRQMMVGVTAPLVAIAAASVKMALEVSKADIVIRKLLQIDGNQSATLKAMQALDEQSRKIGTTLGITRLEVKSMQGEFASVGFGGNMIKELTQITSEFQKLGNLDADSASDMVRVLAQRGYGIEKIRDTLERLNLMENKTALNMKDVVGSFSDIFPLFDEFNTSAPETIALLSAFKQEGVDVTEGANSLLAVMTKLPKALASKPGDKDNGARLKALRDSIRETQELLGTSYQFENKDGTMKSGLEFVKQVGAVYGKLRESTDKDANEIRERLMRSLFGTERATEGYALLSSVADAMDKTKSGTSDLAKALDIAGDNSKKAHDAWKTQLDLYMKDPSVTFANKVEALKIAGQDIGAKILPSVVKVLDFINRLVDKFSSLSDSTQGWIMGALAGLALLGPAVYIFGQSMIVLGTIAKGLLLPFKGFFRMSGQFQGIGSGIDNVSEKLIEMQEQFAKTGDKKLLAPMQDLMKGIESRTEAAQDATRAIKEQTAAQVGLNTANAEGAVAEQSNAWSTQKRIQGALAGQEFSDGVTLGSSDLDIDAEVAQRVEARKAERAAAVQEKTEELMRADRGRPIKAVTKTKGDPLKRKIAKLTGKLDAFDEKLATEALEEMVDAEMGGFSVPALEKSRDRWFTLSDNIRDFQKQFGIPIPIAPNMSIKDDVDRLNDFETRFNLFLKAMQTNVAGFENPSAEISRIIGNFKAGAPDELHDFIKSAMDEANGVGGRDTISPLSGRDGVRKMLNELTGQASTTAPQLMSASVYEEIKTSLNEGGLLESRQTYGDSWDEAVEAAFAYARENDGDPMGYFDTEEGKKHAKLKREVGLYLNSVKQRLFGTSRGKVAKAQKRVDEIVKMLENSDLPMVDRSKLIEQRAEAERDLLGAIKQMNVDRVQGRAKGKRLRTSKSAVRQRSDTTVRELMNQTGMGPESGVPGGTDFLGEVFGSSSPDDLEQLFNIPELDTKKRDSLPASRRTAFENAWKVNVLDTKKRNAAIEERNRAKRRAYLENFVARIQAKGSLDIDDIRAEGLPEDMKKVLAEALFGATPEGLPHTGKGRGGAKGYRGMLRDLLGEGSLTEEPALEILNELAAQIAPELPGGDSGDAREFKALAEKNRRRRKISAGRFAEQLGAGLSDSGVGNAEQRRTAIDGAKADVAKTTDKIKRDQKRLDELKKEMKKLDGLESAEKAEIERITKAKLKSMSKDTGESQTSYYARRKQVRDSGAAKLQFIEQMFAQRRTVTAGEVKRAESRITKLLSKNKAASDAVESLMTNVGRQENESELELLNRALLGIPGESGTARGPDGRFKKALTGRRNLGVLKGGLSQGMAGAIHEMVVTNTVATFEGMDNTTRSQSQLALDVIRRWNPDMPDDVAQEMADKGLKVAEAMRLQMDEAQYYLGRGVRQFDAKEAGRRSRAGRVDTNTSQVALDPMTFDDTLGGGKNNNRHAVSADPQRLVDDLMGGFVSAQDDAVDVARKRVSNAEAALVEIRGKLTDIDVLEEEMRKGHSARRRRAVEKKRAEILAEQQKVAAELDDAVNKLEAAHVEKFSVQDSNGEEKIYSSREEYERKRKKEAEALIDALDDEDLQEQERKEILDRIEESDRRQLELDEEVTKRRKESAERRLQRNVNMLENQEIEVPEGRRRAFRRRRIMTETMFEALGDDDLSMLAEMQADDVRNERPARDYSRGDIAARRARRGVGEAQAVAAAAPLVAAPDAVEKAQLIARMADEAADLEKIVSTDVKKKKGSILNPATWLGALNPAKRMKEGLADGGGMMGRNAAKGGMMSMLAPTGGGAAMLLEIGAAAVPILAVIAAIAAVVLVLVVTFKKWGKYAKGAIDDVKSAFRGLKDAIVQPFQGLWQSISGKGKKGAEDTGNMWQNVGKIISFVVRNIANVVKFITPYIATTAQIVANILKVLVDMVRWFAAVLTGDWGDALDAQKSAWESLGWIIKRFFAGVGEMSVKVVIMAAKGAVNTLKAMLDGLNDLLGKIPGVEIKIPGSGVLKDFNSNLDKGMKEVSSRLDTWVGENPIQFKPGKGDKDGKDYTDEFEDGMDTVAPPELDPAIEEQANADAKSFISAFQNNLRETVDGWKEAAMDALDNYTDSLIANVDSRIDAIDAEVEAERKRQEDLDYLDKKDELRQRRKAAKIAWQAEHDLAIYEGRYSDAKQADYELAKANDDINRDEKDVEEDRQQQLTDRIRDAEKERLEIQKENIEIYMAARKEQLQRELDLLTQYLPKNVAAAGAMHDAIQAKMREYTAGYGQIAWDQQEAWNQSWNTAWNKTKADVADDAWWAGAQALQMYAKGMGVDLSTIDGKTEDANSGGTGGSNTMTRYEVNDSGRQPQYHSGGGVGPESSAPYDIPATLQSGEYVIKRDSVKKHGKGFLDQINAGEKPMFHTGGLVGRLANNFGWGLWNKVKKNFTSRDDMKLGGPNGFTWGDVKGAYQSAASGGGMGAYGNAPTVPGEFASGLNPEFLKRFHAWNAELNNKFSIGSGFRTMAAQARLYARWLARVPGQAQAAPPGKSMHNFGLAIDLSPSRTSERERALGQKHKLYWPMSYEPWHVQPFEAMKWRDEMRAGKFGSTPVSDTGRLQLTNQVAQAFAAATGGAGGAGGAGYGGTSPDGAYTVKSWAQEFLRRLKISRFKENVADVTAWELAEGGHWQNRARYNPLNTTQKMPGAGNTGSQGNIKVYTSWAQGLDASLKTITNGRYAPIISALGGTNMMRFANALNNSPWGTKHVERLFSRALKMHQGGMVFPSMDVGGKVRADGVAKVHAGETVLTKKLTDALEGGFGSGGDVHLTVRFDGGFFGSDRELEKLYDTLEKRVIPKLEKARGQKYQKITTVGRPK